MSIPDAVSVLPPAVKRGDKVSIIAPSGPVDEKLLEAGCALLRAWGLEPVVSEQVHLRHAYLAGTDTARAKAILDAFNDPSTTAVLCARGGYGATRLLSSLPPDSLGLHNVSKKRFFGFSDITALHALLHVSIPGYISFHSHMPATDLFVNATPASHDSLRSALFEEQLARACPPLKGRCLQLGRSFASDGVVKGVLVGGNLSLLTSLLATPWQVELKGAVLVIEDVNEAVYRMDRMWTHLVDAYGGTSILHHLSALVIGDFGNALGDKDLKVLSHVAVGHVYDNRTLPLGAEVEVDLRKGELRVAG